MAQEKAGRRGNTGKEKGQSLGFVSRQKEGALGTACVCLRVCESVHVCSCGAHLTHHRNQYLNALLFLGWVWSVESQLFIGSFSFSLRMVELHTAITLLVPLPRE